jgi:hypothetical protein
MLRPVCLKCKKEMTCRKNGVFAKVCHNHLLAGDRFECTTCGHEIVTGWARESQEVSELAMKSELVVVDLT